MCPEGEGRFNSVNKYVDADKMPAGDAGPACWGSQRSIVPLWTLPRLDLRRELHLPSK